MLDAPSPADYPPPHDIRIGTLCGRGKEIPGYVRQLRQWAPKVLHVHGKDATLDPHLLCTQGVFARGGYHQDRHPGLGDCNWTDILSILRSHRYTGTIDIECWHDPIYRKELEMTGQVHALRHLQQARGGRYIPPPQEIWS